MIGYECVAWDILEHRPFGSPGETRHKVLWIEHYITKDGGHKDLDAILEATRESKTTIYVRPLFTSEDITYEDEIPAE